MTADQIRARVLNLRQWKDGGKRAPHKPLLLLFALARFAEGVEQLPFNTVEPALLRLLEDFGPSRKKQTAFPFWRLETDGIWTIDGNTSVGRTSSGDMLLTEARRENPVARFPANMAQILRANPEMVPELVDALMEAHFPTTLHEDILGAIGFDLESALVEPNSKRKRRRDPAFRTDVIRAYGYRCAVCGFETRVGNTRVGIDAAHVRWHQAGGSDVDEVTNGVALCALHHRLLDRGAFTLASEARTRIVVDVAEDAHGGDGFKRWLLDFTASQSQNPSGPNGASRSRLSRGTGRRCSGARPEAEVSARAGGACGLTLPVVRIERPALSLKESLLFVVLSRSYAEDPPHRPELL